MLVLEPRFSTILARTAEMGDVHAATTIHVFEEAPEESGSLAGTVILTPVAS